MSFEGALAALETEIAAAQKRADALVKAIRRLKSAARSGSVRDIEKGLAQLPALAEEVGTSAQALTAAWAFDVGAWLSDGYLAELKEAAAEAGVNLFDRDGRIYAFPLIVRLQPGDAAVKVAGKTVRAIRPKVLVGQLASIQRRPQRVNEERFLNLLYRAYRRLAGSDWRRVERGPGPAVSLFEMHELLTLLPGVDYPVEEFGRDLLLLARRPDVRTRDGAAYDLPRSTLSRGSMKKVTVYDEDGNQRDYIAICFIRGP